MILNYLLLVSWCLEIMPASYWLTDLCYTGCMNSTDETAISVFRISTWRTTGIQPVCCFLSGSSRRMIELLVLVACLCCCQAIAAAQTRYSLNAGHTDIRFLVYKQGALQVFGYNHVISASNTRGTVIYDTIDHRKSFFSLDIPVTGLLVDRPEDRQRTGAPFSGEIDTDAAQATRANLFGEKILHAQAYPYIRVSGRIATLDRRERIAVVHIRITIKGYDHDYQVPVQLQLSGEALIAHGSFTVRQSDFAIEPLALLGGLLAVRDDVDVVFHIHALAD